VLRGLRAGYLKARLDCGARTWPGQQGWPCWSFRSGGHARIGGNKASGSDWKGYGRGSRTGRIGTDETRPGSPSTRLASARLRKCDNKCCAWNSYYPCQPGPIPKLGCVRAWDRAAKPDTAAESQPFQLRKKSSHYLGKPAIFQNPISLFKAPNRPKLVCPETRSARRRDEDRRAPERQTVRAIFRGEERNGPSAQGVKKSRTKPLMRRTHMARLSGANQNRPWILEHGARIQEAWKNVRKPGMVPWRPESKLRRQSKPVPEQSAVTARRLGESHGVALCLNGFTASIGKHAFSWDFPTLQFADPAPSGRFPRTVWDRCASLL